MRQGRAGQRGKFVQIEPRVSQTGANADEWIAIKPGTEGMFALAIASVILREKLRPASAAGHAGSLIAGFSDGLSDYTPEKTAAQTGIPAEKIVRIAREAAANGPAVALIGDFGTAQTNGLFNALAVNALNALLGSVGKQGGILFTSLPQTSQSSPSHPGAPATESVHDLSQRILSHPESVKVLLLDGANPVFATPPDWHVREAFEKVPFIASFGSFVDETSALADLILPDSSPLESWIDVVPASGSARTVMSMAPPAMNPIHNTRSMPDVLLDVAQQLGGDVAKALPWKTHEAMLQASFATLYKESGSKTAKDADEFWKNARTNGGWWSAEEHPSPVSAGGGGASGAKASAPQFDGGESDYPFYFLPFASQMFYDGSLAHLPWMQEAPDPLSTVMWGTWVEINPGTAEKMSIKQGDILEVASAHGKLQAPALIMPGIGPDTIGMPIGQGHENFTRYATGRGANPISILGPATVADTNSLAWASTRVKISRIGEGKIVMFGANLNENPPEVMHR
jgi:anaerobic selenocysteine-containing dehydrogenase